MFIPKSKVTWLLIIFYYVIALGGYFLIELISPESYSLYGEHANRGCYFILPIIWVVYGLIVYYVGLKFNTKKIYEKTNSIVEQTVSYRREKVNKHKFIGIPVQYVGSLFITVGLCVLLFQIIYRLFWM